MKYCVSIRQPKEVLQKADEIKVNYNDIKGIYNFIDEDEYKDKSFILNIPKDVTDIDWAELDMFNNKLNFYVALDDVMQHGSQCYSRGIKFYWAFSATTYDEVRSLTGLGVSYLLLDAPLYFDLPMVARAGVPIRLIANVCHNNYFNYDNGIVGTYIRPEDVKHYEQYVATLEFVCEKLDQEATLLKIYQNGVWPGNLNLLLTNFGCNIDNRAIIDSFGPARMQCRQNCLRTGTCHLCETAMKFNKALHNKHNQMQPNVGVVAND